MRAKLIGLLGRLPREGRTLIETCIVGLAAGLAAVAFQAGIDALTLAGGRSASSGQLVGDRGLL